MNKRLILLIVLLGLVFAAPGVIAQGGRWAGADNQPVSPLACDSAEAVEVEPSDYDGAAPINAPDRAGQPITLVNVPDSRGESYSAAVEEGMRAAASQLGNVEIVRNTPNVVDASDQLTLIEGYAARGVDGVLIDVINPAMAGAALSSLLEGGVHVVGYGADSEHRTREWFVQPALPQAVAKALIDSLVAEKGPSATFALVTSSYDSRMGSRWIAELWAYASECYPGLEWLETVETQGDDLLAYNLMVTLVNDYDDDLQGVISVMPLGTPQVAEAVATQGRCGDVAVVGLAAPNAMKPFMENGCVQTAVLWDAVDLGYAAVQVARAVADGNLQPGNVSVNAGRLGELAVVNGSEILLGPPLIFNSRNINDYDF